ncbi:MAG: hypothetical protein JW810_02940 [Sedimentisphaerales bacterium]|nr:hypothetical protein [Sedimentisphaerales bacterium]
MTVSPDSRAADSADDAKGCGDCPQADSCRQVWSQPPRGPFSGFGLVLASVLAFWLPLLLAIAAGLLARHLAGGDSTWPTAAGAAAGFLGGALLARALISPLKRRFQRQD